MSGKSDEIKGRIKQAAGQLNDNDKLKREGKLDELISIENQTELILENATPELLGEIRAVVERARARLIEQRKPKATLEDYFLEVTGGRK